MAKRGKILTALAIACGLSAIYLWFFGVATAFALEARYIGWKVPVVKRIPVDLVDTSISQAQGRKISYFGDEFEVPWDDLDAQKTKLVGKIVVIHFQLGKSILFSDVPPQGLVSTIQSSSRIDLGDLRKVYGEEALRSDYSFHRLIVEARPDKVGVFSSRRDAVGNTILLTFKGMMIPAGGESGIFHVQTRTYQGFQYGDPQKRPKSIDVEIFADDGGLGFVFEQKEKDSTPPITQPEINRVIQTARKVEQPLRAGEGS